MEGNSESQRSRGWVKTILIIFFFILVSCVWTWPLLPHFTTHLPHGGNDLYQNLWNLWWWKTAIFELGTSPYETSLLYAPHGLDLSFHTHSPATAILTMPVNLIWGHVAAYNFACLISTFLCGIGAYLLCREITGSDIAALIGGLYFSLFPQRQEQLFEHMNLFSCQYLPFSLYFLIRTFRLGTLKDGLLAGFFFALNALSSWHLGLLGLLLGFPCFVFYLFRSSRKLRSLLCLFCGALLSAALVLPFAFPMLKKISEGAAYYKKPLVYRPIDPAFLVLPPPQSTITGNLTKAIYLHKRGDASQPHTAFRFQYAGFICFLGWIPLLAVLAAYFRRKDCDCAEVALWSLIFLAFLIFACGKHLTFLGKGYEKITLPQGWLSEVGFFRVLRVANRYLIPGSLAFAVLLSMAVRKLPLKAAGRWVLLCAVGLEFLWLPFPIKPAPRWPAAEEFSQYPLKGAVMEIPVCLSAAQADAMLRQTFHKKPLAGGYAACIPPELRKKLLSQSFTRGLTLEEEGKFAPTLRRSTFKAMGRYGISALIIKPHESREELIRRFRQARKEGKLPFFLKELRPGRALPERKLNYVLSQLSRYLGEPAFEDQEIQVWLLQKKSK